MNAQSREGLGVLICGPPLVECSLGAQAFRCCFSGQSMNKASTLAITVALLAVVALASSLSAQQGTNRPQVPMRKQGAALELPRAVEQSGVITCRPLSERAIDLIVGDAASSGLLFVPPREANARVFSTSIAVEEGARTTYASASFAPYGNVGCGMAVDFVTYWGDSCEAVAAVLDKQLQAVAGPGNKSRGLLGSKIRMMDGGPNMRMFLMPAGPGCVQIKKEMLY